MGQESSRPGSKSNDIHNVPFTQGKGTMISMARQRSLDLAKSIFADKETLRELWHRCDANGNGIASLAEVDKMVIELGAQTRHEPSLYNGFFASMASNNAKMGIMRAYKWTLKKEQLSNHDDYIQAREFPALLKNLYFFTTLQREFEKADTDHDKKISKEEFKLYLQGMGFVLNEKDLNTEFSSLDSDQSGYASPLEFYGYCMRALAMTDKDVSAKGDFLNVGYATSSKGRANDFRGSAHHSTMLSSHIAPHQAYRSAYHHAPHPAHAPALHHAAPPAGPSIFHPTFQQMSHAPSAGYHPAHPAAYLSKAAPPSAPAHVYAQY